MAVRQLKVRQLASLYLQVPPEGYGGTERVIANLSAYQSAFLGYEVHVYASSDSAIVAFTEAVAKRLGRKTRTDASRLEIEILDAAGKGRHGKLVHRHVDQKAIKFTSEGGLAEYYHERMIAALLDDDMKDPCDIIHFHDHYTFAATLAAAGLLLTKCVSTIHGQKPSCSYHHFPYPVTALSQNHFDFLDRKYGPLKTVDGFPYVHHGIMCPKSFTAKHAGYVTWLARLNPEKGPDIGVKAAKEAGVPIVFGGSILQGHQVRCYNSMVKQHITHNFGLLVRGSWAGLSLMPPNLEAVFDWQWEDLMPRDRLGLWNNLVAAVEQQPKSVSTLFYSRYKDQFEDQLPVLENLEALGEAKPSASEWKQSSYATRLKLLETQRASVSGAALKSFNVMFESQIETLREACRLKELNLMDIWESQSVEALRSELENMSVTELNGEVPVVFIGVIGDRQRDVLFKNALALLLPHSWTEPFGLTMLEATSLGTPILPITEYNAKNFYGYYIGKTGGLEEILEEGVNGLGVKVTSAEDAVSKMADAVDRVGGFSRKGVRECFERGYTIQKQVSTFDKVYNVVLSQSKQ